MEIQIHNKIFFFLDIDDIKFELPTNHTGTDFFVSKFDKIRKSITDNSVLN